MLRIVGRTVRNICRQNCTQASGFSERSTVDQKDLETWAKLDSQPMEIKEFIITHMETKWEEPNFQKMRDGSIEALQPHGHVLDVGSGSGGLSRHMAKLPEVDKVTAIEPVKDFLEYSVNKAKEEGLSNIDHKEGLSYKLPLPDESVDCAVFFHVISLTKTIDRDLEEALRVLKPGGKILIADSDHLGRGLFDFGEFDPLRMIELFAMRDSGFRDGMRRMPTVLKEHGFSKVDPLMAFPIVAHPGDAFDFEVFMGYLEGFRNAEVVGDEMIDAMRNEGMMRAEKGGMTGINFQFAVTATK